MKIKRYKHAKRVMMFYKNNFGIVPPYHVLVDGTFCRAALKFKINILDQLPKYLDGEIKMLTTKCVMAECEALGSLLYGPLKILQQYKIEKCGHRPAIAATECLYKLLKKSASKSTQSSALQSGGGSVNRHYLIATQDPSLSDVVRSMKGVPLLYMAFNSINIESPAQESHSVASQVVEEKMLPSHQQEVLKELLKKEDLLPAEQPKKKRKKLKGPNPLSCKKKKKKATQNNKIEHKKSRHRKKTSLKISPELVSVLLQETKSKL